MDNYRGNQFAQKLHQGSKLQDPAIKFLKKVFNFFKISLISS